MVHMRTQLPHSCLAGIQSAVFRSNIWTASYRTVSNVPEIFQTTITIVKFRVHCNPWKWLKVCQNGPFQTFPPWDIHSTTHDRRKIVLTPIQSIPEFTQDHETTVLTSWLSSVSNKTSMMSTVSSRSIVKYLASDMIAACRANDSWLWWWPTVKKKHTILLSDCKTKKIMLSWIEGALECLVRLCGAHIFGRVPSFQLC